MGIKAQTGQQPNFSNYTLQDGLSSYNALCMQQDRYGFLWVGTQDGLNRFDGKEFEHYTKLTPTRARLLHNHVKCLQLSNDTLWVATAMGGIDFINVRTGNVIGSITPATHPGFNYWIESICVSGNLVWMGSYEGLLCYDKATAQVKSWRNNPFRNEADYEVRKIITAGSRWVIGAADNDGIVVYDRRTQALVKQFSLKELIPHHSGTLIFNTLNLWGDTLVCGTRQGCYFFKIDLEKMRLSPFPTQPFFLENSVTCLQQTKDGQRLIATDAGIFYFDSAWKQTLHYTKTNTPILNDQVNDCFTDRQGNYWLMTYGGLVKICNSNRWFTRFSADAVTGTRLSNISGLSNISPDCILAASWKELLSLNPRTSQVFKVSSKQQDGSFYDAYVCKSGEVIVSGLRGNYYLRSKTGKPYLVPIYRPDMETGLPVGFRFSSILPYDDTTVFFGAEFNDGLFVGGNCRTLLTNLPASPLRLAEPSINRLYKDKQNHVWCLHDNSVDIIDWEHKKISTLKPGKFPLAPDGSVFFDVLENNGFIWLATYGSGIFYKSRNAENWSVLNTTNGLCNNAVYTLSEENDSIIWASTNIGLSRINTKMITVSNFFSARDKAPAHFDERGALKHDSSLYFSGPDGIVRYTPWLNKTSEEQPTTYIKSISYYRQGVQTLLTDIIAPEARIPYDAYNIKISFAAIDFIAPELTEFFYRFNHKTEEWTGLGEQNSIVLSEMPIGDNVLELRAKSNNGKWSLRTTSLQIKVMPPWYKTLWFRGLLFLSVVLFINLLYRYRVSQLQREEATRTRIAADLHDEIGSTLTSIKVFTDIGIAQSSTAYLPQIKQGVTEAAGSLRDIIWVLDKTNNTAKDLIERVIRYAAPMANASRISFTVNTDEEIENLVLKTELKRDLYLIMKEFINNSFKYARCSNISIVAIVKNKHLSISLKDDGVGFDALAASKGNGLNNIQNRAKNIKYDAVIISQCGEGVCLELKPK